MRFRHFRGQFSTFGPGTLFQVQNINFIRNTLPYERTAEKKKLMADLGGTGIVNLDRSRGQGFPLQLGSLSPQFIKMILIDLPEFQVRAE